MVNEKTPEAPEGRIRRHPLSSKAKLSVANQDPNYRYRIVNVRPGRVEEFIDRGYEIDPNALVGDKRVDNSKPLGSQISVGGDQKAVVMRQRKDWFDEDQAIKQADIDEKEKAMGASAKKGV